MIGASIESHFGPYMQMPAASQPALSEALLEYVRAISSPIYIPNKSFRDRAPIPQVFRLNCVDDIITNLTLILIALVKIAWMHAEKPGNMIGLLNLHNPKKYTIHVYTLLNVSVVWYNLISTCTCYTCSS